MIREVVREVVRELAGGGRGVITFHRVTAGPPDAENFDADARIAAAWVRASSPFDVGWRLDIIRSWK